MIKPTVGRVVWFYPGQTERGSDGSGQPLAALIAYVHSDTCINLAIFDRSGIAFNRTSVELWQGEGEAPAHSHAAWMPYQLGQQAKTEQAEKQLAEGST